MAVKQQRAGVWLACMVVLSASCAHAWTGYSYSSPPPPPCYTKSSPPPPPPCHSPPPPPPPPSPSPPPPPPPPSPSPPPPPVPVTIQAPPPPSGYSYQPPPPPPCYTKSSPPPPPVGYSYQPSPPPPCNTPPPQCGMLALTYSPDLSIVASLIKAAGPDVVAAFSNDSLPFTLLAPVNSAFAGVDIQKLIADNRSLRYILGYHILWPYPLPHNLLQINGLTVNTLSGTKVQLKASAGYNGVVSASACTPKSEAHFILPRYSACKIVIQPINSLLKY